MSAEAKGELFDNPDRGVFAVTGSFFPGKSPSSALRNPGDLFAANALATADDGARFDQSAASGRSLFHMELEDTPEYAVQSLPPVDGGRAAWQYLLSAFIIETLLWVRRTSQIASYLQVMAHSMASRAFLTGRSTRQYR